MVTGTKQRQLSLEPFPEEEGTPQPECWAPSVGAVPVLPIPAPLVYSRLGLMINDGKDCNQIVVPLAPSHD